MTAIVCCLMSHWWCVLVKFQLQSPTASDSVAVSLGTDEVTEHQFDVLYEHDDTGAVWTNLICLFISVWWFTVDGACEWSVSDLPLSTQAYFCDTRCPLCSHSTHHCQSSVFWNVRSPLRSHSPKFLPTQLRFALCSRSAFKSLKMVSYW